MFEFVWADIDMCNEESMISALAINLDDALIKSNERYENDEDDVDYNFITIIVNGVAHRFMLGGPQAEGLYHFMENICDENGYDKPWKQA